MKIKNGYITLNNMVFYAHHGVGEQERTIGNEFYVTLRLKVNMAIKEAALTDDVYDTVSYADVFEAVKEEMEQASNLLEAIAFRIAKRLFNESLFIEEIEIKLMKRNPPMGADIDSAGVELHCIR